MALDHQPHQRQPSPWPGRFDKPPQIPIPKGELLPVVVTSPNQHLFVLAIVNFIISDLVDRNVGSKKSLSGVLFKLRIWWLFQIRKFREQLAS